MASLKELLVAMLLLLFTLFSLGAQSLPVHCNATTSGRSPCAKVRDLVSQMNLTTIPAELAYDCLNSVPLHVPEAKELHRSLIPYLKWQTTLSYVRDPPVGYQMPAFDFWPAYDNIGVKLSNAAYLSEWEFGMDMLRTFNNAHDGHFRYILDIVGKVFSFERDLSVVSVSLDGQSLPKVYVHHDVQQWLCCNVSFPAAVVAIDGQAVDVFLDNWMRVGWHQDLDALYNALFWSAPQHTLDQIGGYANGLFGGSGFAQFFYPGPSTNLLFANGTNLTYPNRANVNVNFTGVEDGQSFYQKFCTQQEQSPVINTTLTNSSSTSSATPVPQTSTPGYPLPVIRHPRNSIAGYYLDSPSYSNLAILSITNFVTSDEETDQADFQHTSQEFIRLAKSAGKTKLILDLRGNFGGTVLQAFDLFKQLFPHLTPWGASRLRAFATVNAFGSQISSLSTAPSNYSSNTSLDLTTREPFNHHLSISAQSGSNFPNWSSLYGPHSIPHRDDFTNLIRFNLSSPLLLNGLGINITGYQSLSNATTAPPFNGEDIVMLHDGLCASTCATFSDLLRTQGGVKSVVVGGRPNYEPMQAVGGTRGMEVYPLDYIYDLSRQVWGSGSEEQKRDWEVRVPDLAGLSRVPMRRLGRGGAGTVNVRDSVLEGSENVVGGEEGVPSQFLWVPSDCRLWYTPEMVGDVRSVWRKVGDVAWGGKVGKGGTKAKARCVVGGL